LQKFWKTKKRREGRGFPTSPEDNDQPITDRPGRHFGNRVRLGLARAMPRGPPGPRFALSMQLAKPFLSRKRRFFEAKCKIRIRKSVARELQALPLQQAVDGSSKSGVPRCTCRNLPRDLRVDGTGLQTAMSLLTTVLPQHVAALAPSAVLELRSRVEKQLAWLSLPCQPDGILKLPTHHGFSRLNSVDLVACYSDFCVGWGTSV